MRKTKLFIVDADNRDKGKAYLLTEMSAREAERWVLRAFLALQRAGVEVPDEVREMGAAAVLSSGVGSFMQIAPNDAMPLLDEMMECVTFVPDPRRPEVTRPLIDDDTEEVTTLLKLRAEVVELHTGFPVAAALSTLGAAAKRQISPDTPTSPKSSAPLSEAASPPITNSAASTA